MERKIKFGARFFILLWFFYIFICMTFTTENIIGQIKYYIKAKSIDPGLHAAFGNNSLIGQVFMAVLLIIVVPFYLKIFRILNNKRKMLEEQGTKDKRQKIILRVLKWQTNLWWIALIGSFFCYFSEFISGIFLNILFKLDVWDYSDMVLTVKNIKIPLHLLGQINIIFFPIWYIAGLIFYPLFTMLYDYDIEMANSAIKGLKEMIIILFRYGGNTHKLNKNYLDIKADYFEKNYQSADRYKN